MADKGYSLLEDLESISEESQEYYDETDDIEKSRDTYTDNDSQKISINNIIYYIIIIILFLLSSNPYFINYVLPSSLLTLQYVYRSSLMSMLFSIISIILTMYMYKC